MRAPRASDAGRIQALAGDRRIADTTERIPHPYPDGAATAWIEDRRDAWRRDRALALAVTRQARPGLVGVVSLEPDGEEGAALGYWFGVDYWGQGYARESASAILDYGFRCLGLRRVTARCMVRNPESARVLVRVGLRHLARQPAGVVKWDRPEDIDVYRIDCAEYRSGVART